jgi:polyisoprenoid-binding protein YceI
MKTVKTVLLTLPIALLVACADPADKVPAANVSATNDSAATAATTAKAAAGAKAYVITPDSSKIEFTGSKVTGKHDGGFKQFQGEVHASGDAVSHAKVTIDTTSLWSDNDRLTGHLKSPDFFDVQKFPTAEFETTAISGSGDNATVKGKLTLHGVTKEITFPAKIHVKDDAVTVAAEFSINRFDFGIKYAGKADDLIREGVVLRLDVKATPKAG